MCSFNPFPRDRRRATRSDGPELVAKLEAGLDLGDIKSAPTATAAPPRSSDLWATSRNATVWGFTSPFDGPVESTSKDPRFVD